MSISIKTPLLIVLLTATLSCGAQTTRDTINSDTSQIAIATEEPMVKRDTTHSIEIDSALKARLLGYRNRKVGSQSGSGLKSGPGGSSQGSGKGSPNRGDSGSRINYNIKGFGLAHVPPLVNSSREFGTVTLLFCLDTEGKLLSVKRGGQPQTTLSSHLEELSKKFVNGMTFIPIGGVPEETNCGTITFVYKAH